jgi:hypothetical protein
VEEGSGSFWGELDVDVLIGFVPEIILNDRGLGSDL